MLAVELVLALNLAQVDQIHSLHQLFLLVEGVVIEVLFPIGAVMEDLAVEEVLAAVGLETRQTVLHHKVTTVVLALLLVQIMAGVVVVVRGLLEQQEHHQHREQEETGHHLQLQV